MKEQAVSNLKRMNTYSLCVAIPVLSFPAAFLGVRALLPTGMQNDFFDFMGRHPYVANFVTYSFYVVAVLGVQMCAVTTVAFVILLFFRGVPIWLKAVMAVLILLAIHGIIVVRHALGR